MKKLFLIALVAVALIGCSAVKQAASKGVNLVASIGTNAISMLDITSPLVQDPAQPDDTNAVVVNPVIVSAAQGAATTFGGPYGLPIAAGIGVIAGIAGVIATQRRRRNDSRQ